MVLAEQSQISVSSVKKFENGEIGSFYSLIRVLRIFGKLDIFESLMKGEEISPNEYLKFVKEQQKKQRKRARNTGNMKINIQDRER